MDDSEEMEEHYRIVECPFCLDTGFDLMGLRHHITHGHCDVYNNTKAIPDRVAR